MNYAVHMTAEARAELERRAADADARISAGTEPLDTLAILAEGRRAIRSVLQWADKSGKRAPK